MKIHFNYFVNKHLRISAILISFLLSGIIFSAYGTNHYVDNIANGSNNGSSWTDAWENFSAINWNNIQPGDTIYISGGTTSQTYTGTITIPAGTHHITITKGANPGHNGIVLFQGSGNAIYCNSNAGETHHITISYLNFDDYSNAIYFTVSNSTGSVHDITIESDSFTNVAGQAGFKFSGEPGYESNNWGLLVKDSYFNDKNNVSGQIDLVYCQRAGSFRVTGCTLINDNNINIPPTTDFHSDICQSYYVDTVYYDNNHVYYYSDYKGLGTQTLFAEEGTGDHVWYNNVICQYIPHASDADFKEKTTISSPISTPYFIHNTIILFGAAIGRTGNMTIKNNIIYEIGYDPNATNYPDVVKSSGSITSSNNFLYDPEGVANSESGFSDTNPLFTSTTYSTSWNGSLQAGSPAINAGADLQSLIEGFIFNGSQAFEWKDINGVSRDSSPDIGAVSYVAGGGGNNPPNQPSNPNPGNGAVNQSINTTLTWNCSDPDGDPLTYDVYFGTTNNPSLVSSSQTSTSYNPGQLINNTTYYWKIVAKDNQGASTAGPLWSFSTEASGSASDIIPPELIGVQSVEPDQVVLDFSEPLDTISALNPSNYIISDQIQVLGTLLSQSHERIILTTSQQIVNHIYTIEIINVTDTAGNVISSQSNSKFYKILDIGSTGYIEHLINNVTASATTDTNTSPQKTLDGLVNGDPDPNSRWASEVMPQWIQYDLGDTEVISLIAVSFYQWNNGRIYQYSIQTSDDEVQWNELVSNTSSSSQEWTLNEFTDLSARYVRIICLGSNQADWAGVWETRIFEPDAPTAVNFSLFTARLNANHNVILNWTTSTEQNCREFNVTRKDGNNNYISIGTVPGHGSVTEPHNYTFTDNTVKGGNYSYRLEEIDFNGNIHYSNIVEIEVDKLQEFTLEQNYPNPFNPTTHIDFSIPVKSQVTLKIFDVLGNEVATLVNERKPQGYYGIEFNAAGLPSGIYFSRIQAIPVNRQESGSSNGFRESFTSVKKMILLK